MDKTTLRQLVLSSAPSAKELPSELQEQSIQRLDLSDCTPLKQLPPWLGQLTGLQQLNLSRCKWLRELPPGLGQLTGLQRLNLSGCTSLKKLPQWLGQLTGLQTLDLSLLDCANHDRCESLEKLPSWLGQLTGLQQLDLSCRCNSLEELPSWLGQLTGLQQLNLIWCESLRELPPGLGQLTGLQGLALGKCSSLEQLSVLGQLTGLRRLNLGGCESLEKLPPGLGHLTGLRYLILKNCKSLEELPSGLGQLTGLQTLDLGRCESLEALPPWLGQLTGLQRLYLSCYKWLELPSWLGLLTGLQTLGLSGCQSLKKLPSWLGQLMGLRELDLSRCKSLEELPSWLGQLTGLRWLNLSRCKWLELPSWLGQLTGLRRLDLCGCQSLEELPPGLGQLTGLQQLNMRNCLSLHTPPRDVVGRGTQAVLQYLQDLAGGSAPCHLLKMVLVGDQRAGKSSLIESLMSSKPSPRRQEDRTVGIDIHRWRPSPYKEPEEATRWGWRPRRVIQVYDAAGHKTYHASNRMFMSRDALYLNVVRYKANASTAVASIWKWMDLVQTASPGCVMVIVISGIDLFDGDLKEYVCRLMQSVHNANAKALHQLDHEMRDLEDSVSCKMTSKAWADHREQRDSALREMDSALVTVYDSKEWKPAGNEVFAQLDQCHEAMAEMEKDIAALEPRQESSGFDIDYERLTSQESSGFDIDYERLTYLREARTRRQRVVFCGGVSSVSGAGLGTFAASLIDIVSKTNLFPHLGMRVPLNYTALDRCVTRNQCEEDTFHSTTSEGDVGERAAKSAETKADWEMACAAHYRQKAQEHGDRWVRLEDLCSRDVVGLADLKEAALQCGIASDELDSALHFLHASGSLLYYGAHRGVGDDAVLRETVFTRPSWIVDAVKCFIHESKGEEQNDLFREMVTKIEETEGDALQQYRETGRLRDRLLCRFWACFAETGSRTRHPEFERNKKALIALFCSLQLMRKSEIEGSVSYVVPAMFPDQPLPPELVDPVWLPPKARAAEAFMRRQYQGVGYVPHGFLGELQVAWTCGEDFVDHFACPEDALASSLGSHLRISYGRKSERVEENVVVSLWQSQKTCSDGSEVVESRLCVMGWASLMKDKGCQCGKTDWRLFKRVTACIEEKLKQTRCALLSEAALILWVDREDGNSVLQVDLSTCLQRQKKGEDLVLVGKKWVELDELLPLDRKIKARSEKRGREGGDDVQDLSNAKHHRISSAEDERERNEKSGADGTGMAVEDSRKREAPTREMRLQKPRIVAFFAQERTDLRVDTAQESMALTNELSFPNFFEFLPYARPRFENFHKALMCSRQQNVRVVHLAGHADRKEGFFFLKDERGLNSEKIEPGFIAEALCPYSASNNGTVDCVVLNACSTEAMARALRTQGIRHVVCWRDKVHDGAALAFSKAFYASLQHDTGPNSVSVPDTAYKAAFTNGRVALRIWRDRTHVEGGAARARTGVEPMAGALDVVLLLSELGDDLRDASAHAGSAGGASSSRQAGGPVGSGSREPNSGDLSRPHDSVEMNAEGVSASGDVVVGATVVIDDDEVVDGGEAGDDCVVIDDDDVEACMVVDDEVVASGPAVDEGGSVDSDDTRSVDNFQGRKECEAFQALGVKMEVQPGWTIEKGINDYSKGKMAPGQLVRYGLEEHVNPRTGRKSLFMTLKALQVMFRAHELPAGVPLRGYADLFGAQGVLVEWAKRSSGRGRAWAVSCLKGSLEKREEESRLYGGDEGHLYMISVIRECVHAIESMNGEATRGGVGN